MSVLIRREPGFYRRLLRLSMPIVLQNLITFSLGLIDTFMVSQLGNTEMAAVTTANVPVFLLISIVSLVLTRPLARKYVNSRTTPTNADMLIGQECVVTEAIDNVLGLGAVTVGGKVWTARTEDPDIKAQVGQTMTVVRIEGVKLIVKP